MKADISIDTYAPEADGARQSYHQVVFQQGRVFRDADINEQTASTLHYLQTLAKDVIGHHGGPVSFQWDGSPIGPGFAIQQWVDSKKGRISTEDFSIAPGRYYVDGILCETPGSLYSQQGAQTNLPTHLTLKRDEAFPLFFFVYLDVWYRFVSAAERRLELPETGADRAAFGLAESALGLAGDTSGRAQVMAQVKAYPIPEGQMSGPPDCAIINASQTRWNRDDERIAFYQNHQDALREYRTLCRRAGMSEFPGPWRMTASIDTPNNPTADPCLSPSTAGYRGMENQLYRVEIHRGGNDPTFKWSRENGAVLFSVSNVVPPGESNTLTATLPDLGPHSPFQLPLYSIVEWVTASRAQQGLPGPLLRVEAVDLETGKVSLQYLPDADLVRDADMDCLWEENALLRRWDHGVNFDDEKALQEAGGAIPITAGEKYPLENGVQVEFSVKRLERRPSDDSAIEVISGPAPDRDNVPRIATGRETGDETIIVNERRPASLRSGDFWQIPARAATGDICWSQTGGEPNALPPHGVEHHYAPLAIVTVGDGILTVQSLQLTFGPLAFCPAPVFNVSAAPDIPITPATPVPTPATPVNRRPARAPIVRPIVAPAPDALTVPIAPDVPTPASAADTPPKP